jgi:hypothetical protein
MRTRKVCVKPASVRYEVIPAEFKMVERKVCVRSESKRRIEIPAKFETRTKEVCSAPARKVWRRVDCQANGAVETKVNGESVDLK